MTPEQMEFVKKYAKKSKKLEAQLFNKLNNIEFKLDNIEDNTRDKFGGRFRISMAHERRFIMLCGLACVIKYLFF